MAIRISGKNLDIGDALRTQVETRILSALSKYSDGRGSGHVTVSKDGAGFRTECTIILTSGTTLESSGSAADAHASFDQSAVRIEKRMRRYKRRIKDRLGEGRAGRQDAVESPYAILAAPDADEEDEAEFHPVVIAETTKQLGRLTVSEAVVELDLTGTPAIVFRNAGHGRVNVVYRRHDGTIGWVDPPAMD